MENVDFDILREARTKFFNMDSKNEQDLHLQRLMELSTIQRSRPRSTTANDRHKPKQKVVIYHVLIDKRRVKVCRTAFLNLYNISKKRGERISNLLEKGETPKDLRGMGPTANAIDSQTCALIHEHIQSFPVKESHYSSRLTKYLPSNLNAKTMHDLFLKKYPGLQGTVKYHFYWNYFRTNFSLGFGRPPQDTCTTCEELNNKIKNPLLNDTAKRVAVAELMVHLRRSKKFYNSLKDSGVASKAEGSKILGVCFDFMAVFDLPKIPVQDVYYFRQLSVNNFGIHNMRDDTMTSYVYHEGIARKSPDDVISFLVHYLQTFVPSSVEEIHLFCDNCGGQNKNHALIRTIMALVELKVFKKIKVFFPLRGHSYLPCDRDFGLIKKN